MNDLIQSSFDYAALPVESIDRLKTWKTEIAAFTDTVESSLVQIGLRFQKAQDELNRQGVKGEGFAAWVKAETVYGVRNAYDLINVAGRFKDKPLANFARSVLYLLSAPSTSDAIIDRAIEKAESGEKVTVADVKDWKAELDAATQRCEEFRQESNERRKKVRELEEQIDLLTIRDRMMQDRLEQATQEINHLATVVPEPEKVIVVPDDYEHLKQTERDLRSDLAELKQQQRELVQQQVVAKLKERESELTEIDRKVQRAESLLTGLQTQIDRYSMAKRELKVHLDTIESARVSMAVLAANLEGFEAVIDPDTELRQWRALADMLRNGAAAIEHFVGNTKPALSVIRGEAA